MRNITFLAFVFALFIGCKRYQDTVLSVKIIDETNDMPIDQMYIEVAKRKPSKKLFENYEIVDEYESYSNSEGICKIYIDNYNRSKYSFSVLVNFKKPYKDYGGYTYDRVAVDLEEYELSETLEVYLGRIPCPCPTD